MSEINLAPRRRPLWRLFIMPVLLVIAAAAWSAIWFYSASKVDETADAWRAREARSGRDYECARRSVTGYPFRLEVRCDGAPDHGQARPDPGGGAGLRSEMADRGVHRTGDHFGSQRRIVDDCQLAHRPQQHRRITCLPAAGLACIR